jgi:T5SS/PEP-CTERM-associated repeat protein
MAVGLAAGLGGVGVGEAFAQTRTWRNAANGTFSTGTNWVGNVAPGAGNPVVFGLNASASAFAVAFTGNTTTAGLTVSNMRPTFNLGGFTYNVTGDTFIGGTNGPVVTVTNGIFNARSGGGFAYVGNVAGQTGTVNLGAGAVSNGVNWVGMNGTGRLNIIDGADISHLPGEGLHIGEGAGSVGTVLVSGAGSTLTVGANIFAGGNGSGSLLVESGGSASCSDWMRVGRNTSQSVGSVTVRGVGSLVSVGGLSTSDGARGDITIENGGQLSINGDSSSYGAGTRQNWTIAGSQSVLNSTGTFRVGDSGSLFTMLVTDGGTANLDYLPLVGGNGTGQATLTVSGAGSSLRTRYVNPEQGAMTLTVINGGEALMTEQLRLGCCYVGGSSTTLVRGVGSMLSIGNELLVGTETSGTHTVTIDQGGTLIGDDVGQNLYAYIANRGTGVLNVDGPGSEARIKNQLRVGWYDGSSNGTFNLTNGASATVGWLSLLGGSDSTAAATVSGGSLLSSLGWVQVGAGSTLNVNTGGGIEALGGFDIRGSQARPAEVIVGAGSYIFATERIDLGNNAPQTEVGILTLEGGTAFTLDYMPINDYGILRGTGTFEGNIGVNGTVQPGLPIGTLNVASIGFTGDRQARLDIQIGGTVAGTQHDRLAVANGASLNGTLALSLVNGFVPTIGQTFDVVTAGSINGQFAAISGTDLGGGKAFVARYLSNAVQLVVDGVTGVDIAQPTLAVYDGFTESLTAIASYAASPNQPVTSAVVWSSDNPAVASVSADGKVTAHAGGNTTIRATYAGFTDTVPVTVNALPVPSGLTEGLDATYFDMTWSSFDGITPILTETRPDAHIPFNPNWESYGTLTNLSGGTHIGGVLTGTLNVPATGTYTFYQPDGNGQSRVYIDGRVVLADKVSDWFNDATGTATLTSGPVDFRVEYQKYMGYGAANHELFWTGPGITQTRIPASAFSAPLEMQYFLLPNPVLPENPEQYTPANYVAFDSAVVPDVHFPYDQSPNMTGDLGGDAGVTFTGWLVSPQSSNYTLYLRVDDGARVYVNGAQIARGFGFFNEVVATVPLNAGENELRIEAYQRGYNIGLTLEIQGPGISRQPIPASMFWRGTPAPTCPADFNGDQFLDFFDYDEYVACFETGVCPPGKTADFNGDQFVDFFDYDDYVLAFETGC